MQSIKLVLDIGVQFIPGVGKALDAGLGALCRSLSFDLTG
jgi:hypothetical protein